MLAVAFAACSASTAHIGSLKVGKDKDVTTETTTFGPHDSIYAKGDASNVGKVTMVWHLIAENVKGQAPNTAIPSLDKSFDVDSDSTVNYDLSPNDAGWPAGTYKIVLTMMEDGQQRDQKTAEITVGGT
jgi:hypothetical protein